MSEDREDNKPRRWTLPELRDRFIGRYREGRGREELEQPFHEDKYGQFPPEVDPDLYGPHPKDRH